MSSGVRRATTFSRMPLLCAAVLATLAGCADNPMVLKGQLNKAEQQQTMLARQLQQLQDRTNALDRDNQEKDTLLAQARQQTKVADDQLAATKDQLRSLTAQLAQVRVEKDGSDKRAQTFAASLQRQGGVSIDPNNSFLQTLPATNIAGVNVRRDGDVIRIELRGQVLFEPGTSRLRPGAPNLLSDVASEIARTYPDQMIGVEGHTDNDLVANAQFHNNHELSASQAMAVYDVLVSHTRLQSNQLFVMGQGANRPVVSNATPEGKDRNRRIELVIYPERKS
ncbi:MAG: OmpA family protein [Planctomycetaceae bacterium]|nr:OmpA family protein [Planctomycetaceae bacterium]